MTDDELRALSAKDLLRLYARILDQLLQRRIVRSRNAPLGDLAELLVARAFDGEMAPASAKSIDVVAGDGRQLQVKARLLVQGSAKSAFFSPIRSWEFAACVFLIFDAHTYDVVSAVEVPAAAVREASRWVPLLNGSRISARADLLSLPGAEDRSAMVQQAYEHLEGDVR